MIGDILVIADDSILNLFDQPVMETNCAQRSRSTVSTQALTLLNSDLMIRAADAFAERVLRDNWEAPEVRATWLAYGRAPTPDEAAILSEFLAAQEKRHAEASETDPTASVADHRKRAIADMCHMLVTSNEFLYVD